MCCLGHEPVVTTHWAGAIGVLGIKSAMVALQSPVFVLLIFLLYPKHDCKVIETVSTTIPTTIPTTNETTPAKLYGGVKENADTWMAFLYLLLDWVWVKTTTGTEYHPGISDPGESHGTSFDNDD